MCFFHWNCRLMLAHFFFSFTFANSHSYTHLEICTLFALPLRRNRRESLNSRQNGSKIVNNAEQVKKKTSIHTFPLLSLSFPVIDVVVAIYLIFFSLILPLKLHVSRDFFSFSPSYRHLSRRAVDILFLHIKWLLHALSLVLE